MKLHILFIILLCLLPSCKKKPQVDQYDLHIGSQTMKMDITNDPYGMEEAFLDQVMPLWDSFEIGESEWFRYDKTIESKIQTEKGTVIMSHKSGLGPWRFYKRADGINGIEFQNGDGVRSLASGENMSKVTARELLRPSLYKFESIQANNPHMASHEEAK